MAVEPSTASEPSPAPVRTLPQEVDTRRSLDASNRLPDRPGGTHDDLARPNSPSTDRDRGWWPVALTPEQRALHARMAAYSLHAKTDSREHTRPAREAFLQRFQDQVDPDRQLAPDERDRRARQALKAHMTALALRSSTARARRSPKGPTREGL
jgi:hypothetical protein